MSGAGLVNFLGPFQMSGDISKIWLSQQFQSGQFSIKKHCTPALDNLGGIYSSADVQIPGAFLPWMMTVVLIAFPLMMCARDLRGLAVEEGGAQDLDNFAFGCQCSRSGGFAIVEVSV